MPMKDVAPIQTCFMDISPKLGFIKFHTLIQDGKHVATKFDKTHKSVLYQPWYGNCNYR